MSNDPNKSSGESYSAGNISNVPGIVNVGKDIKNRFRDFKSSIDESSKNESGDSEIKQVLNELKEAIVNDRNLPEKCKIEALQKLEELAEAAKNSNPKAKEPREDANFALNILKSMTETLGNATQFAEIFKKVLPAIKLWFGLP